MSNKKIGNTFESELCEILAEEGFWCHNLAQNAAGQPADVIAVRDKQAFLIDCKVCSQGKFQYSRIEENQDRSMELWHDCGNGNGWFALKFDSGIYMINRESLRYCSNHHPAMTPDLAQRYGCTLKEWLEYHS